MSARDDYAPGPARKVTVENHGDKWTLILVRDLRHSPEKVWEALTDPQQLREWAPYDVDRSLDTSGTVSLTWVGTPAPIPTEVTEADPPHLLDFGDMRWQLEPTGTGTRLTLWHKIDAHFVTWGAAGWQIVLDVFERLLDGEPIGRIVGPDAMNFGWQRLVEEYAQQFGTEAPKWQQR